MPPAPQPKSQSAAATSQPTRTFADEMRIERAVHALESIEMLIYHALDRNESVPQTKAFFERELHSMSRSAGTRSFEPLALPATIDRTVVAEKGTVFRVRENRGKRMNIANQATEVKTEPKELKERKISGDRDLNIKPLSEDGDIIMEEVTSGSSNVRSHNTPSSSRRGRARQSVERTPVRAGRSRGGLVSPTGRTPRRRGS